MIWCITSTRVDIYFESQRKFFFFFFYMSDSLNIGVTVNSEVLAASNLHFAILSL